jgi:hypothetical protein
VEELFLSPIEWHIELVMVGRWKWQTAEPSLFEVEIAVAKLKRYKSPGID